MSPARWRGLCAVISALVGCGASGSPATAPPAVVVRSKFERTLGHNLHIMGPDGTPSGASGDYERLVVNFSHLGEQLKVLVSGESRSYGYPEAFGHDETTSWSTA